MHYHDELYKLCTRTSNTTAKTQPKVLHHEDAIRHVFFQDNLGSRQPGQAIQLPAPRRPPRGLSEAPQRRTQAAAEGHGEGRGKGVTGEMMVF